MSLSNFNFVTKIKQVNNQSDLMLPLNFNFVTAVKQVNNQSC